MGEKKWEFEEFRLISDTYLLLYGEIEHVSHQKYTNEDNITHQYRRIPLFMCHREGMSRKSCSSGANPSSNNVVSDSPLGT